MCPPLILDILLGQRQRPPKAVNHICHWGKVPGTLHRPWVLFGAFLLLLKNESNRLSTQKWSAVTTPHPADRIQIRDYSSKVELSESSQQVWGSQVGLFCAGVWGCLSVSGFSSSSAQAELTTRRSWFRLRDEPLDGYRLCKRVFTAIMLMLSAAAPGG